MPSILIIGPVYQFYSMAYFLQTVFKTSMEKDRIDYQQKLNKSGIERIKAELTELDREMINAGGIQLKPSQCYHFGIDPLHVLFNTNCPDDLKQKVQDIISRHVADVQ